jgi:hypothetical protein
MIDRTTGLDATLWHLERPRVSPHTLRTAILDPSGVGRQLRLKDISRAFEPRLGLVPRATQRVMAAPGFPARPFWVPAVKFRIADHMDAPGCCPAGRSPRRMSAVWRRRSPGSATEELAGSRPQAALTMSDQPATPPVRNGRPRVERWYA